MFIRSIKLKNYRKFRDEFIDFPEGVIGIIGSNGSGKSSILEAIGWALYGNVMARSDKIEVKSQNAPEEEDCEVELIFDLGGCSYKIVRNIKGKNAMSNALMYIGGTDEVIAERDSGVNKHIGRLLGMDYVTFLRTVYAKQKDLAALSNLRPEERKKVIRRMLNIDKIDLAVTQIRADGRDKGKYIEGVQAGLKDADRLENEKKEIKKSQVKTKKSIVDQSLAVKTITEEREKIKKNKINQEQKYKVFNNFSKNIARLKEQNNSLGKRLKEAIKDLEDLEKKSEALKKIEPKEQEYLKVKTEKEAQEMLRLKYQEKLVLEQGISDNKDDIDERDKKLKTLANQSKEFSTVKEDSDKTEDELSAMEDTRRILDKEAKKIEGEVRLYSAKVEDLVAQKRDIDKLGKDGKCPTCLRKLGDNYQEIIEHFDIEIKNNRDKLEPHQDRKTKISKELDDILARVDKLVKRKNALTEKLTKKSKVEQSLEEQMNEVKKLRLRLSKDEEKLKEFKDTKFNKSYYDKLIEKFEELSESRDTILELRKEVQRIFKLEETVKSSKKEILGLDFLIESENQELEKLDFDEKEFEKVKVSYDDVNDQLIKEQRKLEEANSQNEIIKQQLSSIKKEIEDQKQGRKMIEEARKELQYLQRLGSLLEDFRLELTGRIRPLVESRTAYLFNEVTDGRYPSVGLDEDYEISIFDGNKSFGLKRFSGGEEDLANLCLRIAMSQLIAERSAGADINFIALDEIFGSQDEARKQKILNSLNRLSSQFRQIFLITHIEDIKETLPRVLKVEENLTTKESKVTVE